MATPLTFTHPLQRRSWLQAMAAGMLIASGTSRAAGQTLRLAVVPQFTPVEMFKNWSPVVLTMQSAGIDCDLVVQPNIPKFEAEFLRGRADIVYLNPYHMVMAQKAHRYEPLLRDARPLQGVLVVRKDSPIQDIAQLKNQRIAFPAPNAFAASLYIRAVLEREYHLPHETHYAITHRNAVRQVLVGDAAAAGVVRSTLENETPEVQQALRVIYTTPSVPSHPIAVHPRVPNSLREALIQRLVGMAQNSDQKALMSAIQMPNPVRANYRNDYAPLERLNIEKFVVIE